MNYEEKYKKALEIANAKIETYYHLGNTSVAKSIEEIFPELKDSEDEKIRKEIIQSIQDNMCVIHKDKCIAWLEKQGEQKPVEWSAYDKATLEYIIEDIKELCDNETEEGSIETYNRELNLLQAINESIKLSSYTNPAAWSEEDEPQKELAETYLAVFDEKFPILPTLKGKQLADYKNFLNKCQQILGLKYWSLRPLQAKLFEKLSLLWAAWGAEHLKGLGQTNGDTDNEKQEWSEEDEYHKRQILRNLKNSGCSQTLQERTEKWIEERLKSLRPQNTWKPSDEQMEVLLGEANAWTKGCPKQKILESLYNDLKKLKG